MREEAEMKKGEENRKKDSMNLQKMYEQKLTPQRKVEAFRRYVIKLKRQRNFGRDLSCYEYMQADIRLFREEALYMKGLQAEYDTHVRLSKEIRCLEEMTDEQILCYYTLVKRFQQHVIGRADIRYAKYYLLELSNLIYQDTPQKAYEAMFSFWNALETEADGKISEESREYFHTICRLFMLAFPEVMPEMIRQLEERTGRDWSGRVYEAVEKGAYEAAGTFVRQNARGLKEAERCPEKEYAVHAWKALPYVFRMLERDLTAYDFRHMILNGFYASMYIGEYPVMCCGMKKQKTVHVSEYMYYEYQDFSDYWKFWYYVLRESVQDLLCVIYQYTESRMRWHMKASPRRGSANRIIGKAYVSGTDRPEDVEKIRELLQDEQFQSSIEDGVLDYLTAEEVSVPERKRRVRRAAEKTAQELDYEEVRAGAVVDRDRLRQAKEDAEQVLGMLSEGEIEYETEPVAEQQTEMFQERDMQDAAADGKYGRAEGGNMDFGMLQTDHEPEKQREEKVLGGMTELPSDAFTDAEKQYLYFLRTGDQAAAEEHLREQQMPESVMMKQINNKALELLGDFLLEREAGRICILKDYEEDTDRILGERL